MKYRLGLDLGVGSIGSAIISLDDDNNAVDIVDAGVRIFDVSEDAENRRLKRTARKNLIRTRKRLELLAKLLFENHLWVNAIPEGTANLMAKSPYKIRYDALYKQLDNSNYVGRAILHLAKHRGAGFISEDDNDLDLDENDEKQDNNLSPYDLMGKHLKNTNSQTIGEFFYKRISDSYKRDENKKFRIVRQRDRALLSKVVDYAIPRYLVKDEFNKIWDCQAKYFKQMQKDGLKEQVYNILFYERPSAPYAVGKCIYYRDEDRLLKAHPLFEIRRIYEEVNNIRIEEFLTRRKLKVEERDVIVNELLMKGVNAGERAIKKALGLSAKDKISFTDGKIIKAYLYSRPEFKDNEYIKKLSFEELCDFIEFVANPVNPNDKRGRLYNEDELIALLKPKLKIDNEKYIGDLLSKLPKGRGMLGKTASVKIMEGLKGSVISQREVTDKLAETDDHFFAEEEKSRQLQGKYNLLPYYGEILQTDTQPLPPLTIKNNKGLLNADEVKYGKIANPAVHMILNQLRLVVNDIIRIYGRPYDINIELARDVGMSVKNKKKLEEQQKKNEKLNQRAEEYLKNHRLNITAKNILKYKLAEEQRWQDAYMPGKMIPQKFEGFEIEHIIPRAHGGTDTFNNLCLVNRADNLAKKDMFAYEYFERSKTNEQIQHILKNAREMIPYKSWRFESDAREKYKNFGDKDETNRYLADTRYVSKMAQRYLKAIVDCKEGEQNKNGVFAVRGGETAELRRCWKLEGLEYDLMGLQIPRDIACEPYWVNPDTDDVIEGKDNPNLDKKWDFCDKKKNPEWFSKPRIDHRHHAMDAITIACIDCRIPKITSFKRIDENGKIRFFRPLPLKSIDTVEKFRDKIISVLKNINVSHKVEHSMAGQLHKETGKAILCENQENKDFVVTAYSRKVLDAVKSFKDLEKIQIPNTIKDEWNKKIPEDRAKLQKLKADFELYRGQAEQILSDENKELIAEGKRERKITEAMIIAKSFNLIKENGLWKKDTFKCYENSSSLVVIRKMAYESGNNHRMDFYKKDGKIGCEVIRRFDVNQKDFVPQWKKDGGKIIWSIQQGDLLELDTPNEWKSYCSKDRCLAKVKKFRADRNQISIDYVTDARMTSPKYKDISYMFVDTLADKSLNFLIKAHARKVELTPFGKMKKKHKVLK